MRAFHMNLQVYNGNTQFQANGARTAKHTALRAEMARVGGAAVDIAAFTEVGVADNAAANNITNAFDDFGAALRIPAGAGGARRHVAVIRCGRTALVNNNEVVALVINGNAVITGYDLIYFDQVGPLNTLTTHIAPDGTVNRYTTYLNLPANALIDYRYIVRVNFTLNATAYNIGFIHNRAPGEVQVGVVMSWIRRQLQANAMHLCGGDFNTAPLPAPPNGTGMILPAVGHGQNAFYSPGLTTGVSAYDYWVGGGVLLNAPVAMGGGVATADRTPTAPAPAVTGSDHRGVWIDIA